MTTFDGVVRLGDHQFHAHDSRVYDQVGYAGEAIDAGAEVSTTGHTLCVHTFRAAGWVRLRVEVLVAPPAFVPMAGSRVAEVSLHVASGTLVLNGIDAPADRGFGSVAVPSGWLRARVTQYEQDTAPYDDQVGADSYVLELWPAPKAPPTVLSTAVAVDWIGDVARSLAADLRSRTPQGTLARKLVHGAADASQELAALAASAELAERMDAANLLVFAAEEAAQLALRRLETDDDERVREQATLAWERR